MDRAAAPLLGDILKSHRNDVLERWKNQLASTPTIDAPNVELEQLCGRVMDGIVNVLQTGTTAVESQPMKALRQLLGDFSRTRARQGFNPSETAAFVFSLKKSMFSVLRAELANYPDVLAEETWNINLLLDHLGLYTIEVYQESRNQIISRQQAELLELSTPVVKLWQNILALPLIGTLDSARTQVVMESLLQKIIETGAAIAIIDITGVPMVDTLVAQHLLKTVAAARLMGADCIISGIRPQIAQTIVHLGVELEDVTTKATLADAFAVALARTGAQLPGMAGA